MESPADGAPTRPRPPPNRRRDKQQLSCHACRRRKLKCNRGQPCSNCEKHGARASCEYAGPISPSTSSSNTTPGRYTLRTSVKQPTTADSHRNPNQPHTPNLSSTGSGFRDGFHWTSVLNGLSRGGQPNQANTDDRPQTRGSPASSRPLTKDVLLLSGCEPATREQIIDALPPKSAADRKIAMYFEALEYSPIIIHSGEFLKQYGRFWDDFSTVSVSWLGLLFSVLCLGTLFQSTTLRIATGERDTASRDVNTASSAQSYREKVVQSLLLAKYYKGGPFIVETMIHYLMMEHYLRRDPDHSVSLLLGNLVRVAFGMAYHRDPVHFPNITPFEGETRRRVWATIYQVDLALSTQLGIPRSIRDSIVDTAEPRNLLDRDFDAASSSLPPSRPENELTPILPTISKLRLTTVFGKILDLATSATSGAYSEVQQLDQELTHVFDQLPRLCKFTSMAESILDSPNLITQVCPHTLAGDISAAEALSMQSSDMLQRIFTHMVYHKARIVLHTKQLAAGNAHSRGMCLQAAVSLLEFQHLLDEESRSGGRLAAAQWTLSSVFVHEFLLATSILCFLLRNIECTDSATDVAKIRDILQRTEQVWANSSTVSAEAAKALKALRATLEASKGVGQSSHERGVLQPAETLPSPGATPQGDQDLFQTPFLSLFPNSENQFFGFNEAENVDNMFTDMPSFGLTPWF